MHSLVRLTGSFSVDKLKKIVSQVEVLANQPQLKVDEIFTDQNPLLGYRQISVDDLSGKIKYHVIDVGRVKNEASDVPLGSKIYSEEEVEKLR